MYLCFPVYVFVRVLDLFFRALLPTQTACMEHHVWSVVHALATDFLQIYDSSQHHKISIGIFFIIIDDCIGVLLVVKTKYHILEYLSHHKFPLSCITVCASHFWPDFMF